MHEQITLIGALIALFYVSVIGSIMWWMLHVPKAGDVEQHVRRMVREQSRFARILVPVQADVLSDRIVALASQMAKFRGASMDVLYVIEVPLTLPINADMTGQEQLANDAFTRAEKIAAKYDVRISKHVERARQAGPTIVLYAQANNADLLLMADVPKNNHRGTQLARTVAYVFENAPCEVLLDRPAMEEVRASGSRPAAGSRV
jgi:nucleotide-binding universal stress UspA family protein